MHAKITSDIKKVRKYLVLRTKYYRTAGLPVSLKATDKHQHFCYGQQVLCNLLGSKVFSNTLKSNRMTISNVFNAKVSIKEEQHHLSVKPKEETEVMGVIFPSSWCHLFLYSSCQWKVFRLKGISQLKQESVAAIFSLL